MRVFLVFDLNFKFQPMVPQQVQPVPQGMMVAPVGRPGTGPPTSQGPSGMAGTQPGQSKYFTYLFIYFTLNLYLFIFNFCSSGRNE